MFYFEQNHQLETIEPALKKGLELDKNNPLIHFCYGLFYKKQNNLTQAVKCLENSCKFYLFNDQAWVELAECYQELKNFDEALKCYEKALDLNALNRRALIFKGIYCFEKREMTDAENTFKKASSLDPTDLVPFIYLGKQSLFSSGPSHCQSAALYFKSAIKMNMNSEMAWIGLIECYLREKSSEHAIAELNEWVVENPKHPYPLAFRAAYYLERGQLNNAFLDLKQAKTLCSTKQSPVVYALLAGYYIKEEEIEKASQAIEQAKELSSTHDLVLLYQGLLHLQKNQFQEAIACLKIVGKRYPEHALCFALIANCYHALTDNEHELKILYLEKALNLNPFNSYALNLKAFISLEDGELAQAREAANLIIQMNCNDHLTYACLGECCRQEDELDQALKFFDRSIELNSCFEFSWTRILLCYRKMDLKTKLSQSYFELKTKSYPTNPYAWTARALYFFKNGNIELVEKDYQQALALKSVSPFILDCYIEFVSRVKKPADVISHLCKLSESMHLPIFSLSRLMELLAVDTVLLNKVAIGEIAAQQTFINALKALIHLNNDQVYSAEKCIKKIERSAPKSVNALTIRGLYELKIGDSRKAKSLLNEAHNLDPREPFIIALLGKCLMKLSQNSLSMQYFNRALWLDPTVLSIWFIKADFYFNAGDFIKAAYCYKQMIHLQPNQESFYFHYGECLFKQENFSGALIIFGQLTDLDSQKRQVECLFNLKNYAEAERKIRQILKQNITNSSLLALLGACLFELNELQEAKNTILSVLLIDNKNQLANLYLKKMGAKSAENEVLGVGV